MKLMNACKLFGLLTALATPGLGNAQQTLTLTVTGVLVGGTCDVNALDRLQDIDLYPVTVAALVSAPGQSYRPKPFFIRLENCAPGLRNAKFSFNGMPDEHESSQWANTHARPAPNVALHIERSDTNVVISPFSVDPRTHSIAIDSVSRTATFAGNVSYWRKNTGAPGEGGVTGQTVFTIDYD